MAEATVVKCCTLDLHEVCTVYRTEAVSIALLGLGGRPLSVPFTLGASHARGRNTVKCLPRVRLTYRLT